MEGTEETVPLRPARAYAELESLSTFENVCKIKTPIRFCVAFLILVGLVNLHVMRCCLSVAIVDMVAVKTKTVGNFTEVNYAEFNWSLQEQGILLSSFFWGYSTSQLPGALLAFKFGGKNMFGIGILAQAILAICLPCISYFGGFYLLLAIRILQGVFEGTTYPCMVDFLSKWTPKMERSFMYAFVLSGNYIGMVAGMSLTGIITSYFNWQISFIIYACVGISWFLAWQFLVTDLPENHPFISNEEAEYIKLTRETDQEIRRKWKDIPMKKILSSKPVWVLGITMFAEYWGQATVMAELPTFLSSTYQVSILASGIYSGFPYLLLVLILYSSGLLLDYIRRRNVIEISNLRKMFVVFGFGSQILLTLLFINATSLEVAVTSICFAIALGSAAIAGYGPTVIELSPKYSAVVMSICNTVCNFAGLLAPMVCGLISGDTPQWSLVFYVVIGMHFTGALFYALLGSSVPQEWG